jgi:flagellar biosynthetic protein FliO
VTNLNCKRFLYSIGFFLFGFSVNAADYYAVTANPTYEGASYSVFGYLIKVIFYLALLAGGLYYLLKNVVPRLKSIPRNGGQIEVIDFRALTPNASCQLVKVGSRYFLLGVSGAQVNLIQELKAGDIPHSLHLNETQMSVSDAGPKNETLTALGSSFNEILKKLIKK